MESTNQNNPPELILTRHTGALLMYFQQSYRYTGDPEMLISTLLTITIKNLLFGWWGIKSLFINPFVTIRNWVRFSQYKKAYREFHAKPNSVQQRRSEQDGPVS